MPYQRTIDKDGIIITRVTGDVHAADSFLAIKELESYIKNRQLAEIVLHDPDVRVSLSFSDNEKSKKIADKTFKNADRAVIALVSEKDPVFALCRQLQVMMKNEKIHVNVFRTEESARVWVNKIRSEALVDSK